MHILLTDILTCPRCGPQHGLIVLADHIADRRVLEGRLGCANCRTQYPVHNGAAALGGAALEPRERGDPEAALRLAALLGLRNSGGYALLAGPAAAHAVELAQLLDNIEVIAIAAPEHGTTPTAETIGVNRVGVAMTIPLATGRAVGVVLSGAFADTLLEEGARVLSPVARMVLEPPPPDAEERLERAGLRVRARDHTVIVAGRT